jgi:hypothetical protein
MSVSELVHQAIQIARAGRKTEARDLLIQVVELDSQNELAWMWLPDWSILWRTRSSRLRMC